MTQPETHEPLAGDDLLRAVEHFAREGLDRHGLHDWTFRWDRAKRRMGLCRFTHKEISLSRPLTERNGLRRAQETILHEIAHALVGAGHGHDAVWRATVAAIGGRPERLVRVEVPVPAAWIGHCPTCGGWKPAHRRRRLFCRSCAVRYHGGWFDEQVEIVWERADRC